MLEARNLGCVRGDRSLFSGINFTLPPGTCLQVQGANGSGKTSLLRIICGLSAPEKGEVRWGGENIRALGEEYSRSLSYIGHRNAVKDELSSLENLRISNGISGFDLDREGARLALEHVGLAGRENLPARYLSEGQRRRSALARLVTGNTTLWVLDEVLASLDAAARSLVNSLIERHLSNGGIAVVATHQELALSAGSFQRLELTGVPGGAAPLGWPS